MFKNVKHQNQVKLLIGLKCAAEFLQEDSRTVGTVGSDRVFVGFDTVDVTEAAQAIEQETVAAAHIQNSEGAIMWQSQSLDFIQDGLFPRPPPPMFLIKDSVLLCVVALHRDICLLRPGVLRGQLLNIRCGRADTGVAA